MLMHRPFGLSGLQSRDAHSSDRSAAQRWSAALLFVIGLLLLTLLVYASAKYGIANPDVIMG
jgi:hypothetical protein